MERMGHTSPQVALRYQPVMAGRDQAIAVALEEPVPGRRHPAARASGRAAEWHASGMRPARKLSGSRPPRSWWALSWRVGGGDDGTRTHDPLLAKQVLFQLSYIPVESSL